MENCGINPTFVALAGRGKSVRGELIGSEFDAVWCVFGVDDHERLHEAISTARKLGFELAVSNPCFEIWLLWHYEDCERPMRPAELRKRLKRHGMLDKDVPPNFVFSELARARERATKKPASDVPDNPGSGVWRLGDHLRDGRKN